MSRNLKKGKTPQRRDHQRRQEGPSAGKRTVASTALRPEHLRNWLLAAALAIVVFCAYMPAWHGGFIWDDDAHVTRPELRSWDGLYRIWFQVDATLQYYPLLHSAFWIEHKLWGDAALGYHLVNLTLHTLSALMVALILRRLAIPGAFLAAAIFALHPVHVESVAWIAEQKNTLSAVFYLGAMLTYLRFDQTRKISWYLAAVALFSLGMLCKTVIATLPGAMLVIFWWQRGRLLWKKDILPLLPFFLLGAAGGMITSWWELKINKCEGPEFIFTPVERLLIAGRAVWFHLWKLVWPAQLTFIYPRWSINADAWRQYLFPLAAAAALAVFWAIRRWTRAPLAAALFFGGTLFPVLGFFNLYTFRYSLVANHYQYLASLGIIVLASAGAATLLNHWRLWGRWPAYYLCGTLLMILVACTFLQSRMYANAETLYWTTVAQNPGCWLAQNNLGVELTRQGRIDDAMQYYHTALKLKPDYADAHNNLGVALARQDRIEQAIPQFQKALKIRPNYVGADHNLAAARAAQRRIEDLITHYRDALKANPDDVAALNDLAWLRATCPQSAFRNGAEAVQCAERAFHLTHGRQPAILDTLATAYAEAGRFPQALQTARKAVDLAEQRNDQAMAKEVKARIRLYETGTPYREHLSLPR